MGHQRQNKTLLHMEHTTVCPQETWQWNEKKWQNEAKGRLTQSHCNFFVVGSFLLLLRKHNRIARFFYCLFLLIAFKKTKKFHSCLIWCMIFLVWNLSWIPFHHFQSLELLKWKIELARKIYFHVQLKLGHNRPLDSTKHLNKRVL